jgi:RNA polymerase sigma-70 factor (ECF subfamily)
MRIVINQANQQLRKKHLPTVPLESAPDIADDCDGLETAMIRNEEHQFLRRTLEKLPTEQRKAVVLRYFSDLTVPEVAKVMGKREGTIKSRLSRALNRLHEILRDNEIYKGRR